MEQLYFSDEIQRKLSGIYRSGLTMIEAPAGYGKSTAVRWAMKKYKKLHPDTPLPHITPHVFRHTFCTNYANDGMDIKNLQYLMGHSDAGVTLNVYTHASYAHAAEQMAKISQFRQSPESQKDREVAVG